MTEAQRQARNEEMLAECYRPFAKRVRRVIEAMETDGFRPRIQCAHRTIAEQRAAYLAGNSKLLYGFHNVTGEGGKPESLAVDVLDDGKPLDPSRAYLIKLSHYSLMEGLSTGIGWGLPMTMRKSLETAAMNGDVGYSGKVGWDPTHIQPMGITVAETKAGKRPT